MGSDCSACACNDQKDLDETTVMKLEKDGSSPKNKLNEKE
jgi:hypothetical protein